MPRSGGFTLEKSRYPYYKKQDGPQGRSGMMRKISPPPVFDALTVQPVTSCYTGLATLAIDRTRNQWTWSPLAFPTASKICHSWLRVRHKTLCLCVEVELHLCWTLKLYVVGGQHDVLTALLPRKSSSSTH